MRTTLSMVVVLAGLASSAMAQTTVSSVAVQTGTIQPGGPRPPANGDNFFNIEGLNNGTFASYGVARWDLSQAKAALDAALGAGSWQITSVAMELTQDNAAFSTSGSISVYYSTDDTTDCKTAASPLAYPFFDPVTTTPDLLLGNSGNPILQYNFNVVSTGTIDRYTQTGSFENGVPLSSSEVLNLASDMTQHIAAGQGLTLVFVEGSPASAATYNGQVPFGVQVGPNLFITAAANAVACYANCDGSTAAPLLTANDFQCFLNKFAANDPYANCDGSSVSPILNANDFQCFLNKFAAGCT